MHIFNSISRLHIHCLLAAHFSHLLPLFDAFCTTPNQSPYQDLILRVLSSFSLRTLHNATPLALSLLLCVSTLFSQLSPNWSFGSSI